MAMRVGRIAAAVVVITGALMTGGCTATACSSVLFSDQVVVHFAALVNTDAWSTLRACVGSSCEERPIDRTFSDQTIPIAVGPGSVTVSVTTRNRANQKLFSGSTRVTTVVSQPDGPGCQSVYLAKVTVTGSGLSPTG